MVYYRNTPSPVRADAEYIWTQISEVYIGIHWQEIARFARPQLDAPGGGIHAIP